MPRRTPAACERSSSTWLARSSTIHRPWSSPRSRTATSRSCICRSPNPTSAKSSDAAAASQRPSAPFSKSWRRGMGPRSTSRSTDDDLVVGVVRAPHGVRGEVKVDSRTDVPGRFRKGSRLLCDGVELVIASVRGAADIPIVRFEGHETRTDAERLRGKSLRVSRVEARRAAKSGYLWADLLGLTAETPEGDPLGSVHEVLRAGETDVLVIRPEGSGPDLLVPAIASVVREVDVPGGRGVIAPQEALGCACVSTRSRSSREC